MRSAKDAVERVLNQHALLLVACLLLCGVLAMGWYHSTQQDKLVKDTALQQADIYARALAEFRTLYTSKVVKVAKKHGLTVTHDYEDKEAAIPLPATLSMLLGNRIGEQSSGVQTSLYSRYPFPWRVKTGGLQDDFARDAWVALNERPDEPFHRIEVVDGRQSLRYAIADRMRPACVNCHNTHPDTPKRDWTAGDVRGVLEVAYPIDTAVAAAASSSRRSLAVIAVTILAALLVLAVVFGRQRRFSVQLERTVAQRTAQLAAEESFSRAVVENIGDAIVTIDESGRVLFYNDAAESIFGHPKSAAVRAELGVLIPLAGAREGTLTDYLTGTQRVGDDRRQRLEVLRSDGEEVVIEFDVRRMTGEHTLYVAVIRDLTEVVAKDRKMRALNEELMRASRQAGMAEVATGVLHNVGNVLNSVNVSASMVYEKLQQSKLGSLEATVGLLADNSDNLPEFLGADRRGKLVIPMLSRLAGRLREEQQQMLVENQLVRERVGHIKSIVSKQQKHAKFAAVVEQCSVRELIDDAVAVVGSSLKRHEIELVRQGDEDALVTVDRHIVLQILVNLVKNSKQAIELSASERRQITIVSSVTDRLTISVTDTGIGIAADNLERMFTHGFTTKSDGHGFGLHNSALGAQDLGGTLSCTSAGIGQGATFTLDMPATAKNKSNQEAA